MTVRQIDERKYDSLRMRARLRGVSAESLARDAIYRAAELTRDEKLMLIDEMQAWSRSAIVPGAEQVSGVDLIRESRDVDH